MTRVLWALCLLMAECAGAAPCSAPAQRELDFWLGEWEVRDGGETIATSRIERGAQGCVIRETYVQKDGFSVALEARHEIRTLVDACAKLGAERA